MLYAPPNTAVFHQLHQGWTVGDHLAAAELDVLRLLWWAKTKDGQDNLNRPTPIPRPGAESAAPQDEGSEFTVTVEDYLRMVAEAEAKEGG